MGIRVGILGTGVFLPEEIRRNDWWPQDITEKWEGKLAGLLRSVARGDDIPLDEGTRAVMGGIEPLIADPFQGTVERRVIAPGMVPSDMEVTAARQAIERSGVNPQEIDLVISAPLNPDHLTINMAAVVHEKLNLSRHCLPFAANAMCSSFCAQMVIASSLIAQKQAKLALLTQSSAATIAADAKEPFSAWLGDGATAVVVGQVDERFGFLASSWRTDSDSSTAMVDGVRGKRWYEDGPIVTYMRDTKSAKRMVFGTANNSRQVLMEALGNAGFQPKDVDFYASHQSARWMRRVTQEFSGLGHARFVDTFASVGSLSAANIPLQLHLATEQGLLRKGDLLAMFGQGSGATNASVVMRWGR